MDSVVLMIPDGAVAQVNVSMLDFSDVTTHALNGFNLLEELAGIQLLLDVASGEHRASGSDDWQDKCLWRLCCVDGAGNARLHGSILLLR